ncbi:hypothetical protein [Nocardia seriolae]|uniref:hypothetical protein n=1 Tax=Nocardia seriolae TaxID=37332 RepID=UPI0003F408F2|nr:hypothetical protein [Nocardia seriolae]WKY50596.1 hypothetical protein Q5P07_26785 [Nocardia seriolae]BEK86825.1 hypothetical protein NSERKGN1266_27760 [Nocardia seriolae]BEK97393.1 hypothetical protein NSER024013_52990 [Nocardia seriolae]GAM50881.1 hypothetical protein NS07_v2contig00182-0003 [Nocardia seriolae]GEM27165.1 hypothetical protein NS2_54040 [Nocardia seriolae NBRC 15557]
MRYSGRTDWLAQEEWESGTEHAGLDPFDGLPSGLLGLFDILVTGPLGSDLRCTVFLAEGMSVEHSETFRIPVPGGLSPSLSLIDCEFPLSSDHEGVSFEPTSREARVQVCSGDVVQTLVITPPHIEFRVDELGTPAQWRTSAQSITMAELEANSVVAARIPGHVRVDFALLDAEGTVVQIERPEVPSDNVFHVRSRTFVDTVRRIRVGELVARVDDPAGGSQNVVMARIRPTQLCGGVGIAERELVFEALAAGELGAFVWAVTAPWHQVWQLRIEDGRAWLPDELCVAGPLLVQVFVDDPWLGILPPRRPGVTAYRVEQPGWLDDENPSREKLSRFLGGQGVLPGSCDAVAEVWAALAALPPGRSDTRTELLRGGLVRVLARDPRGALEVLGGATIPAPEMVPLLIRTGLTEQRYASTRAYDHMHANPWVGCLVEIADLPYRARTEVAGEWDQMLGYLRIHGGEWLISLLRGKAGDPRIGVFDRNVERAHDWPPSQIDEMLEVLRTVPEALLDEATRMSAIMAAFRVRQEWMAEPALAVLTAGVSTVLRRINHAAPVLYDMIRARNEALDDVDVAAHPWMLLSLQSLTMAALARLSARGRFDIELMTRDLREAWSRLADLCPELVVTDLLIADALATYETHGDLIGEDR